MLNTRMRILRRCPDDDMPMKVWSWEPIVLSGVVDVAWEDICDMHVSQENQLIACSFQSRWARK
jgi:hypothetical protein